MLSEEFHYQISSNRKFIIFVVLTKHPCYMRPFVNGKAHKRKYKTLLKQQEHIVSTGYIDVIIKITKEQICSFPKKESIVLTINKLLGL